MTTLLLLVPIADEHKALLLSRFRVIDAPDAARRAAAIAAHADEIELVLTNGSVGFSAAEIAVLTNLKLLAAQGAGYENLDVAAAKARGVLVCNGAGTNDDCVADHAMALLLASVRALPRLGVALRAGIWRDALPLFPNFMGRRLGVIGMGGIGRKIAARAAAFGMVIGYHNRRPREDAGSAAWFDSVAALATWADDLVVATPGGAGTRHIVNAEALAALGPGGHVVNIARGSCIDTAALAAALAAGQIGGAALDVYESEPQPPAELLGFDNVILTPHIAGWSPQSIRATVENFIANVDAMQRGEALPTPI
ncbi:MULTISPECIES: NAD(P)-dependent oxidoreductase [unclassified Roseateles]|uniref:NAD(P)-dependent oxidoreductase n=1 Tax=unclassified Roseateles TaxID=2626991 RepID=UPI0006FF3C60|nr:MULTISPECIES: NAD(P)-dependent oxidoreductase [unclassified Roseateles]KQW46406.1 hydroxyacid dehydrogenase [Pelomonas sp. Root405]KRA73456.1 hydroxyacid dehydrogenase [Pelomonas sp. Root662]